MGAFPFLFASEPTSRFSVFSLAVVTPSSSSSSSSIFSSSSSISSSSSYSEELCSDSESLSMRTLGKEVLRVTGAIREGKTFASRKARRRILRV